MTRFIALLCATMNLYRGKYIDRGSDFSREILYREKNKFKYLSEGSLYLYNLRIISIWNSGNCGIIVKD